MDQKYNNEITSQPISNDKYCNKNECENTTLLYIYPVTHEPWTLVTHFNPTSPDFFRIYIQRPLRSKVFKYKLISNDLRHMHKTIRNDILNSFLFKCL